MQENKPKNQLIKLFLKGILLIFPLYLLWFAYIRLMPMYYNQENNTRWYFIKKSLENEIKIPTAKILFLGESRVNAGVNFTKIRNSYSFASGGSSSIEMYYILKKYLKNHEKPDTVFLSISPRFLSEIFAFYTYATRNNLFSWHEINEITSTYSATSDTILGYFPKWNFFLYKSAYLKYYQTDVKFNYAFGAYKQNKNMIDTMIKMRGGRVHPNLKDSCSGLNEETKYKDFKPSQLIDIYFDKILNLCEKESIYLIFDFMPMNESSYKKLNPKFISSYKKYIQKYQEKYNNFSISDTVYFYSDDFFGDPSHLNSKGKAKFTKYLLDNYFAKKDNSRVLL